LPGNLARRILVSATLGATVATFCLAEPQSINVIGIDGASIRVDGRLDDAAWTAATALTLTQQSPHPGAPSPYTTTLRVVADRSNLYFGFTCTDPEPDRIAIHTMQRDGDMEGDDSVAIVLDTFGDGRTAYLFRVNAAGARADGLIADRNLSLDWDGVWDARVERTEGWSAEIVVPATTLRFASNSTWGFNAERYVARERQTLRWSGISLDARLSDLHRAGHLAGIDRLQQGLGLSSNLNMIARNDVNFTNDRRTLTTKPGLDIGYNATPQLGAVLTFNTDFAETEVDTRQINLTRFPLFFPEKRSFFLEGSNQYQFGGANLTSDFIPFYSRRIGLFDEETVPLHGGAKVIGRTGKWGIAALDVQTGSGARAHAANLFSGRLTYDLNDHLRLGAIATNGNPDGIHDNRLAGVDVLWSTSTFHGGKNLSAGGWLVASGGDDHGPGRRSGWGAEVDYPNDLWDVSASVFDFGQALDPALGFLPRPGTRKYLLNTVYAPRTNDEEHAWIRQNFYELFLGRYDDRHGNPESWRMFMTPFNVESHSGVHVEWNYVPQFERIDVPFEVANGVNIKPGKYRFARGRVEAQSSPNAAFQVGSSVWFGDFYDGRLTETEAFVNWTQRAGRLRLELETENDFGHVSGGRFVQRLAQFKAIVALTPNLIASSYTQYDSESRDVGVNNRLRWTIHPNAELFVVWNRGWKHPLSDDDRFLTPLSDQFVVKFRWIVRR
jgi:hypothetical protein